MHGRRSTSKRIWSFEVHLSLSLSLSLSTFLHKSSLSPILQDRVAESSYSSTAGTVWCLPCLRDFSRLTTRMWALPDWAGTTILRWSLPPRIFKCKARQREKKISYATTMYSPTRIWLKQGYRNG